MANLDKNGYILSSLDGFKIEESNPGIFDGGTADARGNDGGAADPTTLFTVTGTVLIRIFAVCETSLTGATATVEVGVAGNTASLIAQTTGTDLSANDIWVDSTPSVGVDTLANLPGPSIVVNSLDIIETIGTSDVTAGKLKYICMWRGLTEDASVVGV